MKRLDALIEKQKRGETLDEQQLESIESLDDVISKLEFFLKQATEQS